MPQAVANRTVRGKAIVITNELIDNLMFKDPRFLEAFPFLPRAREDSIRVAQAAASNPQVQQGRCRPCQGNKAVTDIYNSLKRTLAEMPDAGRAKLRELLGASHVRISYITADRRSATKTF
jgi:hypothetical protein